MSEETVSSRRRRGSPIPPDRSSERESSEPTEDPSEEIPDLGASDASSEGFIGRGTSPTSPLLPVREPVPTEMRVPPVVPAVVVPPVAPSTFLHFIRQLDSMIPSLDIIPPVQVTPVVPVVTPVPILAHPVPTVTVVPGTPAVAPAQVTTPLASAPVAAGPIVPFQLYADLSRDYDVLQGRAQQLSLMYDRLLDRTVIGGAAPVRVEPLPQAEVGGVVRGEHLAQGMMTRLRAIEEIAQRRVEDLPSSTRGTIDPCLLQDILDDVLGEIRAVVARGGH